MGLRETPARLSAKSQVRYLAVKCFALPLAAHATPVRPCLAGFFIMRLGMEPLFPPGHAQVLRKATRMNKQPFVSKAQLDEIIEHYPTPFHLYDEAGIRRNMEAVRDAFAWNPGFREYFAVKATPNPFLINILHDYGCGCDCSSASSS